MCANNSSEEAMLSLYFFAKARTNASCLKFKVDASGDMVMG
jgi:hypothetical protein